MIYFVGHDVEFDEERVENLEQDDDRQIEKNEENHEMCSRFRRFNHLQ